MSPKLKPETLQKRKAQILKAAMACFARKGYHQTTMDDIVQEAGLSKGGLYWHFGSKKELFMALFEPLMDEITLAMSGPQDVTLSAREKLEASLEALHTLSTAADLQDIMPLLVEVWAQNLRDPEINAMAVEIYDRFRGAVIQVLQEGMARGEFKEVDASALAAILLAVYDGLAVQWMIAESMVDWDAVLVTLKETLLAGLMKEKPPHTDRKAG